MGKIEFLPAIRIIGIIVVFCGVVFFLLAIVTMRDNWRAGVDKTQKTNIVSNGIYKYSRNPAFVGFDFLYIGTMLTFPNVVMVTFTIIAIVLLHMQILEEEKHLSTEFGQNYVEYKIKTARYILF